MPTEHEIIIPLMFTRTMKCNHCAQKHLPHGTLKASDILKNPLRFAVKPSSVENLDLFEIRKQTKPGALGFTPHTFWITDLIPRSDKREPLYIVKCYCAIEGCGMSFIPQETGFDRVEFHAENDVLFLTIEELTNYYMNKNVNYMLDNKERQHYYDVRRMRPLCLS